MASAGSLYLSLRAETDKLKSDLSKAQQQIAKFSRDGARETGGLTDAFKRFGLSAESIKKGMGGLAVGAFAATDAFKDAGKAGAIFQASLGSFLVGGPIAAGFTLLGGIVKELATGTSEAEVQAKAANDAFNKWLDDSRKRAEETTKSLQKMRDVMLGEQFSRAGISISPERLDLLAQARDLHVKIAEQQRILAMPGFNEDRARADALGSAAALGGSTARGLEEGERRVGIIRKMREQLQAWKDELTPIEEKLRLMKQREEALADDAERAAAATKEIGKEAAAALPAVTKITDAFAGVDWDKFRAAEDSILRGAGLIHDAKPDLTGAMSPSQSVNGAHPFDLLPGGLPLSDTLNVFEGGAASAVATEITPDAREAGRAVGESFTRGVEQTADPLFMDLGRGLAGTMADAFASALMGEHVDFAQVLKGFAGSALQSIIGSLFQTGLSLLGGGGTSTSSGGFGAILNPILGAVGVGVGVGQGATFTEVGSAVGDCPG